AALCDCGSPELHAQPERADFLRYQPDIEIAQAVQRIDHVDNAQRLEIFADVIGIHGVAVGILRLVARHGESFAAALSARPIWKYFWMGSSRPGVILVCKNTASQRFDGEYFRRR